MKKNMRGSGNNVRAVKQETREIKDSVIKIERHMFYFNDGMSNLTNYVKVKIVN